MLVRTIRNIGISILIGATVAVIYFGFESAFTKAIEWLWIDTLDTDSKRLLVIPLTAILAPIYFYTIRKLDPKPEKKGDLLALPKTITLQKMLIVLIIGFFSMLAGASLGPEAILFPSCLIAGALLARRLSVKADQQLMTMIAVPALMAAFFSSFWVGVATLALLIKPFHNRLPELIIYAGIAVGTAVFILQSIFQKEAFVSLPKLYAFSFNEIFGVIIVGILGWLATYFLRGCFKVSDDVVKRLKALPWFWGAVISGLILGILYFIGGSLVEFTGNHSIEPMLQQASKLGVFGLAWVILVKNVAIAWSRNAGYRGGMIFPTVFVAFTIVALVHQLGFEVNPAIGVVAALIGLFGAGRGTHIFE